MASCCSILKKSLKYMNALLNEKKPQFEAVLQNLHEQMAGLRTGRASPMLFENIKVKAYDATMDIKSIASLHLFDAKTVTIEPWDKSLLQAVEKGIREADIGVSPTIDGQTVRVVMPALTEETRIKLVKTMKDKLETSRISLRGVRDEVREEIIKKEKAKAIGEDEKFRLLEELDEMTREHTDKLDEMAKKKEAEIMTV